MGKSKLFLLIDAAGYRGCLTAAQRELLSARILSACHRASAGLTWGYKLVNTSVTPRAFEAALHDACTSSHTGDVPLPFTPEEHVRCNCTMFEGLRRWLHEISQDTFSSSLTKHAHKTSPVPSAGTAAVATWKAIERQLQDLPFAWFEASDKDNTENHSTNMPQTGSSSADDYSAVVLLSPAPQSAEDFGLFLGTEDTQTIADSEEMLADRVSLAIAQRLQRSHIKFYWSAPGPFHLGIPPLDTQQQTVCFADGTENKLPGLVSLQQRTKLQWALPADIIASLDAMVKKQLGGGGMLSSSQVLSSAEQHEIDIALMALLPELPPADRKEAFPAADLDMQSVAQQLDSQIAPADAARFRQLAEEARKQKQAKRQARKERKRPAAAKPQDEAAARLAEHRAKVMKQERELHRAKAEQQKAELAAKHRLLLQRERGLRQDPGPGTCDPDEVMSTRRAEAVEAVPLAEPIIMVDPSISASGTISHAVSVRDAFLQGELHGNHEEVLAEVTRCAEELVASATGKLLRCSESTVTATSPSYPPCPSPSTSRLAASPATDQRAAPLHVVRQALERALLQSNDDFWRQNPTAPDKMADQDPRRRGIQAMQFFLRLHILVACKDDIPLVRLVTPPVIIPTGPFWDELEAFWSDLVHELPNIPVGANEYFAAHLKPSFGAKIPQAIQMIGRNCGLYTEDDLLLNPEGDGGAVVGDSCCPGPSSSKVPASRASSMQPSGSRGSGSLARPAVSDNSSGHGSGSTLPPPRPDAAAAKPKAGNLPARPLLRKRDLTQRLGNGRQVKWNPKAAALPKGKSAMAGGRPGRKGQPKKLVTPPPRHIRASDLAVSPSSTEDSDAIPGTERKGQREASSAQPKASKRHLTFCPIPTIQELEAEDARDDDADSMFGEHAATEAETATEEVPIPAAKGWLQNASRKVPLGRFGSRNMSRGVSGRLPPAPALHAAPSTRLSQLLCALSPKHPPAPHVPSPPRPTSPQARGSPQASYGLRSPSRFSPGPSRMSPHRAGHAGSPMVSPNQPVAVQRSLLSPARHRPAQRALLSPERTRAIRNVLLSPRHVRHQCNEQQASAPVHNEAAAVSKLHHGRQAQSNAVSWGPRPASATFSSTMPPHNGTAEKQRALSKAVPAPPRSPFASLANQVSASDSMTDQEHPGSAADLAAWPQSASFSNEMLQQDVMDAPVSRLLLQQHASSAAQGLHAAKGFSEAATSEDQLEDSPAASPTAAPPATAAEGALSAEVPQAVADSVPLPQADLSTGATATEALLDRPTSAFAAVADLPAPMAWQASKQADPPLEGQPTCAELRDTQQEEDGSATAQVNAADVEVIHHKKRRKPTTRKRMNPCMESQPLASADQADASSRAQCLAAENQNAEGSAAYITSTVAAGDAFSTGPVPSSVDAAQEPAKIQYTAAEDSPHLQAFQVLDGDHKDDQQAASVSCSDRQLAAEAMHVEHVAGIGSEDGSLAAVPPSDDEEEVPVGNAECSSLMLPEQPAPFATRLDDHSLAPEHQPLVRSLSQVLQPNPAVCDRPVDEAAAQQQGGALAAVGIATHEGNAAADIGTSTCAGADVHQAPEASQQQDAQSPTPQTSSMPDPPAEDIGTRAALVPAEAADKADPEAEPSGSQHAAPSLPAAFPAPAEQALLVNRSFRKPGRQRKSQKPTAEVPDVALQLDEGKSAAGAITRCQFAKTGKTLRSVMQDTDMLAPTGRNDLTADSASDAQRPQLLRRRQDGMLKKAQGAGAPTESQLGCSKCRHVANGCKACRARVAGLKQASGRGGRKRAPSASAAPSEAANIHHSADQVAIAHKGKQLQSRQPAAEAAEPDSRAARAANRALKRPASKRQSDEESDGEQLAVKPMPASLQPRKLQSGSRHRAQAQTVVKATIHGAVTVDLPSDRPSSSAVTQTSTLESGASPQPAGTSVNSGEAPNSLRRSARHQHSAQPIEQGFPAPEGVRKAAAHAATSGAAASECVASDTLPRTCRARKPTPLHLLTRARASKSPPGNCGKAQPPQSKMGSRGVKRSAAEHAVISDSEDDTPSASTAAGYGAPAGKSTTKKKLCRQQVGGPALSPIQEADEQMQQQPDPASEFVNHRVHTLPGIAQHLDGLSPAEKRKRRRKTGANRAGSPAKSRLAASAETSQLQTEQSIGVEMLLAAADVPEARAQQDSEPKGAWSAAEGLKRRTAASSGRALRSSGRTRKPRRK